MDTKTVPRSMHTDTLLSNLQQDLEGLFASTLESTLLIEVNGIILTANDVSAKWLRQSAKSLTGENLFQILTPLGIPIREWVHKVVTEERIYESDFLFSDRFIHIRIIPIATNNKVRHLILIGQDITDHKNAKEQVREFTDQIEKRVQERTIKLQELNKKLTEDRQRAELLASLSQHLMQDTQDYSHLLEHITSEITKLIGDTCLIALFPSDLTLIEVLAISDRDTESQQRQRKHLLNKFISVESNPIVNHVLKGERFSAQKITKKTGGEILPPEFVAQLGKNGLKALEVYPLYAGDILLGMLAIAREHGNPYSTEEIAFVDSLTGTVALAIQNARLFTQLTKSQNQLRGLSQKLVRMQENHFRELAGEMHDRIGQDMTAINVNVNILQAILPKTTSEDIFSRLADIENLVQESVKRMRSLMSELRPPMLDQYGLAATLFWYCEQYQGRTGIKVAIDNHYMKRERLPSEIEIAMFRIAQEALNNVAKYAKATQVNIELFEESGNFMLVLTDNGVGFNTISSKLKDTEHWGLMLMKERAQAVNGDFILRSVPGQGTQIVVRVIVAS